MQARYCAGHGAQLPQLLLTNSSGFPEALCPHLIHSPPSKIKATHSHFTEVKTETPKVSGLTRLQPSLCDSCFQPRQFGTSPTGFIAPSLPFPRVWDPAVYLTEVNKSCRSREIAIALITTSSVYDSAHSRQEPAQKASPTSQLSQGCTSCRPAQGCSSELLVKAAWQGGRR